MPNPIPITREEYASKFGAVPATVNQSANKPIPITREEYATKFGTPATQQSNFDAPLLSGTPKDGGNFATKIVNALTSSERGLGGTIGGIVNELGGNNDSVRKSMDSINNDTLNLVQLKRTAQSKGQDTTRFDKMIQGNQTTLAGMNKDLQDIQSPLNKSTGQVLGELGGTALDALTFGTYSNIGKEIKAGVGAFRTGRDIGEGLKAAGAVEPLASQSFHLANREIPSVIQQGVDLIKKPTGLFTKTGLAHVAEGAGIGYGYDVTQGLQGERGQDRAGGSSFIPGAGTLLGGLIPTAAGGYKSIKGGTEGITTRAHAVDSLEQTLIDLGSGTTLGKKNIDKLTSRTNALNRAGTEGRTSPRVLAESGIIPQRSGTKLSTYEQSADFRKTIEPLKESNRNALKETGLSTQPVSLEELKQKAINYARTRDNILAGRADKMVKEIDNEFDILNKEFPTGSADLGLVDAIKSARWDNVFKNRGIIDADVLKKDSEYAIAKSMQKTIEEISTKAGNPEVAQLNREIGDRLEAAKYLESLNGKTIKGGRLLKYITTLIGSSAGHGVLGKVVGAIGGNLVGELIISGTLSNPVQRMLLKDLEKTSPSAYEATLKFLNQKQSQRESRLLLPAGNPNKLTVNEGRPIKSFPQGNFDYIGADKAIQSKSPIREQTTPAMIMPNISPIPKTIPQTVINANEGVGASLLPKNKKK